MIALSLSDITLSFGTDVVLKDVSFSINDGDRVGVIGVNGAGKTSLFRVITGEYSQDSGAVYVQKGHSVGILEQNPDLTALPGDTTVIEYMYTAFPALLAIEEEIAELENRLHSSKEADSLRISDILTEKNRLFAEMGGLQFRSRCKGMLLRLGFDENLISTKIKNLSGGQYTRLALARLLATEPDILMLDEPTNHLDVDALIWLEGFISNYKKTVIIISHDRYFLDRTTNKTLHLQFSKAKLYHGSYSACKEQQEAELASIEKRYKEQQKEIAKIKANIEFQRRCNREHNFVTIRSKEKQLMRMEKIELPANAPRDIRMTFSVEEASANDVLTVSGLGFFYGEKRIFDNLSFLVRRGERVVLLGANGSGKSTLMKLINSRLTPSQGKITLGYNIKIGYYDQENRGLCESNTVFGEMRGEYPQKTDLELRSTLALFLFGAEDMDKEIRTLSGGERARLTFAKLILKKVNLLILDEPTNHLDIGSSDALENALLAFDGTIIAVSHDRYFVNRIATRIIDIESSDRLFDYHLEDYDDAYSEYLRQREARKSIEKDKVPDEKASNSKEDYQKRKRENAERRALERKIESSRIEAAKLEAELSRLDEELFTSAASDYVRAAEIDTRKNEIEERLLELYELIM